MKRLGRMAPTLALAMAGAACSGAPDEADPFRWDAPIRVATGKGYQGPWRMNASDYRYVDDPTVAFYPNGDIGVAWVNQARQNIFYQRYRDGRPVFEEPTNVSRSPDTFSWLPRLVIEDDGRVRLLWQEIVFSGGSHGGEAFFARSNEGGQQFEAPTNLSQTRHGVGKGRLTSKLWHNGSLDVAGGPNDRLYAAWTEYEGPLRLRYSDNGGRRFGEPRVLAGGDGALPTRGPSLAVGPEGVVHISWTVGEDPEADIRYTAWDPSEDGWAKVEVIAASPARADAPKLAVAGDGTVHLTWMESTAAAETGDRIRYTRMTDTATSFQKPTTVSRPLPEPFADAGFPHLVLDGQGNPALLFELFRAQRQRSEALAAVRSTDGGETFTSPMQVPRGGKSASGINGSLQGLLMEKFAVNDDGRIAVVNSTFAPGERSDVWLIRGYLQNQP